MSIIGGVIDGGFLGIAGLGVWRGQSLWSRHIELKHAREMERLGMDRMEKSIRLEMEQTRNLAEIDNMKEMPALPSGELAFDPSTLPFVCRCTSNPSWHLHVFKKNTEHALSLSLGAIQAIRDGKFDTLRASEDGQRIHHNNTHGTSLHDAGFEIKR